MLNWNRIEIINKSTFLCLIDWNISDMQNKKDSSDHFKNFLHFLDFVRLLWKTVYDTSVFEILANTLYLYIVYVSNFFISLFIWLNTNPFCLATVNFFIYIIWMHVVTTDCQIEYFIISDFCTFNIVYTFIFKFLKKFVSDNL